MADADHLSMPPPPPRPGKRRVVLEEDTYAEAIEAIIERDFFPALPKLQNQLEWLQAVQSGDPAQIKRAQLNIARRRAGLKTPLAHEGQPGTSSITPGTALLHTPAMTPALGGNVPGATPARTPAATAAATVLEQQGLDPVTAQQQVGAKAPALGLDQFFNAYQGEDNASFQELQQKAIQRKRAKMAHHLEDKNKPLLLEAGGHSTDEYGSSGQTPSTLQMTKHVAKSALYYDSSQMKPLALTAAEQATIVQGPPKSINLAATRSICGLPDATAEPAAAATGAAAAAGAAEASSEQRPSKAAAAAAVAPGTKGYGYMKTPQVVPGVDASPLMTWGDIASTPLRLDPLDDDIEGLGVLGEEAGPANRQFTMPQVRTREVAAQQMLAGRSAAAAGRRQGPGSTTPLLDSLRRGGPGVGRGVAGSTPVRWLSAAGLKLAQQLGKGSSRPATGPRSSSSVLAGGNDLQLRASYKGGAATPMRGDAAASGSRSVGRSWDMTPGRAGAGGSKQRQPSSKIHVQPGAAANRAAAAGVRQQQQQAVVGASVTDDLLKLG